MTPVFVAGLAVMLVFRQWIPAALFGICTLGGWAYLHDDPESFWHRHAVRARKARRR